MTTEREISREQEALTVIGTTASSSAVERALIGAFIVFVSCVALAQPFVRVRSSDAEPGNRSFGMPPRTGRFDATASEAPIARAWNAIPDGAQLATFARRREERSAVGAWVRPVVQSALLSTLRVGNGSVVVGDGGWLFFRQDVEYSIGKPFLDPDRLARRRLEAAGDVALQPDPVLAVTEFDASLRARGVRLVVLPVPVKPSVYPEYLGGAPLTRTDNPSFVPFVAQLRERGVLVVDLLAEFLAAKAAGVTLYHPRDTHWNGAGIAIGAERVARLVRANLDWVPEQALRRIERTAPLAADLVRILRVRFPPEEVECPRVEREDGAAFSPTREAPIAVIGDSFALACSTEGSAGGLAAELAYQMQTDVDLIATLGGGDHESRFAFLNDPKRFAATRVVVLEFATRELAFGDWRRQRGRGSP